MKENCKLFRAFFASSGSQTMSSQELSKLHTRQMNIVGTSQ